MDSRIIHLRRHFICRMSSGISSPSALRYIEYRDNVFILQAPYSIDRSTMEKWSNQKTESTTIYSPNSRRTRFSTLSFSGSYGWSLLGISSTAGNGSANESTLVLMRSAIYNTHFISIEISRCNGRDEHVGWSERWQYPVSPLWSR